MRTRKRSPARAAVIARQQAAMARALDALERDVPHKAADIGSVAVACALGYLDFRFASEPWRDSHPQLATWFAAMLELPGLARTVPVDPG